MRRRLVWVAWTALLIAVFAVVALWGQEPYDEGTEMLLLDVPVADGGLGTVVSASSGDTRVIPSGDTRVTPGGDTRVIP